MRTMLFYPERVSVYVLEKYERIQTFRMLVRSAFVFFICFVFVMAPLAPRLITSGFDETAILKSHLTIIMG